MTTKRKNYTKEFKLEAVKLLEQGDKPPADIARELGIKRNQLCMWQDEVHARGSDAFPDRGCQAPAEAELASLKRENERFKKLNHSDPFNLFT